MAQKAPSTNNSQSTSKTSIKPGTVSTTTPTIEPTLPSSSGTSASEAHSEELADVVGGQALGEENKAVELPEAPATEKLQLVTLPLVENSKRKLAGKKNIHTIVAVSIIAFAALVLGGLFTLMQHKDPLPTTTETAAVDRQIATVTHVEGQVEYNAHNSWQSLPAGQALEQLTEVRTGNDGRVAITLEDNSVIRLNVNSLIKLRSLRENRIVVELLAGETYTRVTRSGAREFEVVGANETYVANGTAYLTVNSRDRQGVFVFQSTVTVKEIQLEVDEGQQYLTKNSADNSVEGKILPVPASELEGNDFIIWNTQQDKSNALFVNELGIFTDTEGPSLTITSPNPSETTTEESIIVRGVVGEHATVSVNGNDITLTDGAFSTPVMLIAGENTITVIATDTAGNKTTKELIVTKTATPIITLKHEKNTANGLVFSWTVADESALKDGYRIVKSLEPLPVYNEETAQASSALTAEVALKDGQTYYWRVCIFDEATKTCSNYSNEISAAAPQ